MSLVNKWYRISRRDVIGVCFFHSLDSGISDNTFPNSHLGSLLTDFGKIGTRKSFSNFGKELQIDILTQWTFLGRCLSRFIEKSMVGNKLRVETMEPFYDETLN